jgi:hypothetical protein
MLPSFKNWMWKNRFCHLLEAFPPRLDKYPLFCTLYREKWGKFLKLENIQQLTNQKNLTTPSGRSLLSSSELLESLLSVEELLPCKSTLENNKHTYNEPLHPMFQKLGSLLRTFWNCFPFCRTFHSSLLSTARTTNINPLQ